MRINAVVCCAGCQQAWRISASQIQRVAPGSTSDAATAAPVAPTPAPTAPLDESPSPAEDDPMGGSSVTGLSGLTEIMQAEPNETPALASGPPQPIPSAKPSRRPAALSPAQRRAARSRRRTAILLMTLLALVIAMGGVGLIIVQQLGGDPVPTESSPATDADPTENSEPTGPDLDSAGAH